MCPETNSFNEVSVRVISNLPFVLIHYPELAFVRDIETGELRLLKELLQAPYKTVQRGGEYYFQASSPDDKGDMVCLKLVFSPDFGHVLEWKFGASSEWGHHPQYLELVICEPFQFLNTASVQIPAVA